MSKTKLTQEDITSIISLYQTEIPSTHQLAERFKVGHRKISQILKEANVEIQSRGAKITIGNSSDIESATINRYKADLDKRLVAVCKKTGVEFALDPKAKVPDEKTLSLYPVDDEQASEPEPEQGKHR